EVPTRPTPLEREGRPLTVGVNSFGAGGTNAHVVLQEFVVPKPAAGRRAVATKGHDSDGMTLYMLSAAHRDSLRTLALRPADFLSLTKLRLDDIAFSAFTHRSHYSQLLAVAGRSAKDVAERLRKFAWGQVAPTTPSTRI